MKGAVSLSFAERLKEARTRKGLKQVEFAEMIGVSQKDISRWENGVRTPNIESLISICNTLEVSADELLELRNYS